MRSLIWTVKNRFFAIDVGRIREVCPVVAAQPLPSGPPWMLGLMDYHGALIPLLDAGILTGQEAVEPRIGSRTLLIEAPLDPGSDASSTAFFGLRVEQTIGLRDMDAGGSWNPAEGLPGFEHLREVMNAPEGRVQMFDCSRIVQAHRPLLQGASAVTAAPDRRLAS